MAKQNHGIVQDERGQDQPVSKKAAHRTEPTFPKDAHELDPRDIRDVHDPINYEGKPQPDRVPLKNTPHEAAQPGAAVRQEPDLPQPEPSLPEGLRRPRTGPYGRTRGRTQRPPNLCAPQLSLSDCAS
jgi:hypothetical protein